jgi:AcrR family transcriptional regulator
MTRTEAEQSDTRQRIIQGAVRLFAEQGYAGATTRAIAEAAGVNEVTLFRHFGNKKNLMQAVIEQFSTLSGLSAAFDGQLSGDCREDLFKLGLHFLEQRKAVLMALCAAERMPEIREIVARPPILQRQMLSQYLQQQIERGKVRELPNPELAAQAFFGMLFEYAISYELYPESPQAMPDQVVAQFVDIFVRGIGMSET